MTPLSIENRINEASIIVEGVVTESQSYWDNNEHNIYTVHRVEVYKNMKSNTSNSVFVVTMGGEIDNLIQVKSNEATLRKGDVGTFFLKEFNSNINLSSTLYSLVGAAQGVIKYDYYLNKASGVFSQYQSIEDDLYSRIQSATGQSFHDIKERPKYNANQFRAQAAANISSFSPTTATAGTGTVLTINGNNFGAVKGRVGFSNANNGGSTFALALDSQVISWSNTSITVEIPSFAGTGPLYIITDAGGTHFTSTSLTVPYARSNPNDGTTAYSPYLVNDDGNGGLTLSYHTGFDGSTAATYFEEAFDVWNCESNFNLTFSGTTTTNAVGNDGLNIIQFDNGSLLPTGSLGAVSTTYSVCSNGNVFPVDMDITWSNSVNWYYGNGTPPAGQHDFKSVALHELGHAHLLNHVINTNNIMHYSLGTGESRYVLSQNDIDGANYIMSESTTSLGCGIQPTTPQYNCCEDININNEVFQGNVEENGTVNLNFDAVNYDSIQWQVSTDNGATWADITNGGNYSGISSSSLNITNVPLNFDGNIYRAFLNNLCNTGIYTSQTTLNIVVYTAIPDDNFEAELSAYDDILGDNRVPTNNINTITLLDISDSGIQDMTGIESFVALENLDAHNNPFISIDLASNTSLLELRLDSTSIISLNLQQNGDLIELDVSNSPLSSINLSGNSALEILNLESTTLAALDLSSNSALKELSLEDTATLSSVDISDNELLERLNLGTMGITNVIFGNNTALESLQLSFNQLTALDLSNFSNLKSVSVGNNNLQSLNIKNGNNTNITTFITDNNPALNCILVDDATHSTNNWTQIDAQTSFSDVSCGYTPIPDSAFETRLGALGYDDTPNDAQVPTWLIEGVTILDVENRGINDLTGIEDFSALTNLNCSQNSLESLDLQANTLLEVLNCERNLLTSLNIQNNTALLNLNCNRNLLTSLNVQNNTELQILTCERNNINSIDLSNNEDLEVLDIERNNLTAIDVSNNPLLRSLVIKINNGLNQLDVSQNPNLEVLLCNGTSIPSLDLSNNNALTNVQAHTNNTLTAIDLSNATQLQQLLLFDTQVNTLDVSDCAALKELNVRDSRIVSLNLSTNGLLEKVDVSDNNDLTFLNLKNQNNTTITSFDATNTANLSCVNVDDAAYSTTNWTNIDAGMTFGLFCEYTLIPDNNFEAALSAYDDIPNDGQVPTVNINSLISLDVRNKGISNLSGIEDFTSLEALNIRDNNLETVDLTSNTGLKFIFAQDNVLTSINVNNLSELVNLGLARNQITALDVSSNVSLRELYLAVNQLTSLDLSQNPNLEIVGVNSNNLQNLNVKNGNNTNITTFSVSGGNSNLACILVDNAEYSATNWTLIDSQTFFSETNCTLIYTAIPDPAFEAELSAYDNFPNDGQIPTQRIKTVTYVDVRNAGISSLVGIEDFEALEVLDFIDNNVDSLNVTNAPNLRVLRLRNNNVSSINLSQNSNLEFLLMENNGVESIDLSNNLAIEELYLGGNQITELDLSNHAALKIVGVNVNNLNRLNIKNGNNTNLTTFVAGNNPNLNCILVDDVNYAQTNFTSIDAQVSFSDTYCRYTAIPDANFETVLDNLGYDDISGDGQVPTALIENITSLNIESKNISNLSGIEDFKALTILNCKFNSLSAVNLSENNNLEHLYINNNNLTDLNITNLTNLKRLEAGLNNLGTIDLTNNNKLENLQVQYTNLAALDISNLEDLKILRVFNNQLSSLDLTNSPLLVYLDMRGNTNVSSLDLTHNSLLNYANLQQMSLTSLDLISNTNLNTLLVDYNELTALDVSSNTVLETLDVELNNLATITFGENTQLNELNLGQNKLTSLDVSGLSGLTIFEADNNELISLNVKNGNNINFTTFNSTGNSNLTCILVDDAVYSNTNWTSVDSQTSYNDVACISYTPIPDINFETALENLGYDDVSGDGQVPTALIEVVTSLDISGQSISDLTGIKDFTALQSIDFSLNSMQSIDISGLTNLESIYANPAPMSLTSLDVSNLPALKTLTLNDTGITQLDVSDSTLLEELIIPVNSLTSLDISANTLLEKIEIRSTPLGSLNTNGLTSLVDLTVKNTLVESLDLTDNIALEIIDVSNNQLNQLNIRNGNNEIITSFDARFNDGLTCILVDNVSFAEANFTNINDAASFTATNYCRYTAIPDTNFEAALENLGYDDISGDGKVPTALIEVVTSLRLIERGLTDMTGIEDFEALVSLELNENNFTSIDLSHNHLLEVVDLEECTILQSINISDNPALRELNFSQTSMTTIDLSNVPALEIFDGSSIDLSSLDVSNNPLLVKININDTEVDTLDVSNCTDLVELRARSSNLNYLNIMNGNNTNVTIFDIRNNPSLTCVRVDDITYSSANWTLIDVQTSFSDTYCRYTAIPDTNFESELEALGYDDISGDGQVPTALIEVVTSLNLQGKNISDLSGIEDFTLLVSLNCRYNSFLVVDLSENINLEHLNIRNNSLTNLDVTNLVNLKVLEAGFNNLGNIDVSNNTNLERLELQYTNLMTLDVSALANLNHLSAFNNQLSNLDVTNNPLLEYLNARGNNNITSLDIRNNTLLDYVNLQQMSLTSLDISNNSNITSLIVNSNDLMALDVSNLSQLTTLRVDDNELIALNVQNGNNVNITTFNALGNLNLVCVLVDDATYSVTNWTDIEPLTNFNETSCSTDFSLNIKVFLQGPALNPNAGEETLMRDDLRVAGYIPTTSPYPDGMICDASVFNISGTDAIVDWIWVELRDINVNTLVSYSQSALLQRDGDIVGVDGISKLNFSTLEDSYYVAIKHRNHLGIMTSNFIAFSSGDIRDIDFTYSDDTFTHGVNSLTSNNMPIGVVAMWAGNVSNDAIVRYQGSGNDTNTIKDNVLANAGNTTNSNLYSYTGYDVADVNLDGTIKYQGSGNDVNTLKDVVLAHPNNQSSPSNLFMITEQLPEN
ncbi:matrixin family metalloprotease [Pseudofulvibacter geojedonensis]